MTGTAPELQELEVVATSNDLALLAQQLSSVPASLNDAESAGLDPVATLVVGVEKQHLLIHSHVLLARSMYAKALLDSNFREATERSTIVHLPDLTYEGVRRVMQYMYSASFSVSACTVLQVLEASRFLMVPGCEQRCADYIAEHLDNDNCLSLLDTALHINSVPLQQTVLAYLGTHLQAILRSVAVSRAFPTVTSAMLQTILSRSDLEVNEDELYCFVESWLDAHASLELQEGTQVLSHISYAALSLKVLQRLASAQRPVCLPEEWVQEALSCKEDVLQLSTIPAQRRLRVPTPVMLLHGRGWFKSLYPLELELAADAKQAGCCLDLQADRSCAYVHDPRALFNATTSFHVEAWVNPGYLHHRFPYYGPILSKHSTGKGWELRMGREGIEMLVTLRKEQTTWHEIVACHQDVVLGGAQLMLYFNKEHPAICNINLHTVGEWIHMAAQYDGTCLTLYVNGQPYRNRLPNWNNTQLQRDPSGATPINDDRAPLAIGKNNHWQDRKLHCKVTGVRVIKDRLPQTSEFLKLML